MRWGGAFVAWDWLERHPVRTLGICFALAALLRLPFMGWPLQADEGGFLMVAQQWHGPGSALYTDQWVDRPPLLLVVFKLAAWVGPAPWALRLVAFGFGAVAITAAWWAGRVINGAKGASTAAIVAAALYSSYANDGFALTGEAIAGAFVLIGCALVLQAKYGHCSPQTGIVLALSAGIFASLAFLTKQNFIDGGLFAFTLLVIKPHKTWRLLVAGAVGLGIPLLVTAAWAVSGEGPGISRLWVAMFRFRQRSLEVVEDASLAAPLDRLKGLLALIVVTGMALLIWQLLISSRRIQDRRSLRIALVVMLWYVLLSIAVGASWWRHYLLQLAPVLALGAAHASGRSAGWLRLHYANSFAVIAAIVATMVGTVTMAVHGVPGTTSEAIAGYLSDAAEPGDSLVIAYGAPEIIQGSGLTTPYRYAWSLPIRARDPHLSQLVGVLEGTSAPTWILEAGDFGWWGLDNDAFREVRAERYRLVATVCGRDLYQLTGLARTYPPEPACS